MRKAHTASALALAVCVSVACSSQDDLTQSHPDTSPETSELTDSVSPIDSSAPDASDTGASDSGASDSGAPIDSTLPDTNDAADVAEADAPKVGIYIDAVHGHDDTGDGSYGRPFLTVSKGGSAATKSGQTIYAFPGKYPLEVVAVTLVDGVGVEALTYGTVTFGYGPATGNSYGLTFKGSGFVHGIAMDRAFINVSAGTVTLDGVQSGGLGDPGSSGASAVNVSGTGKVVITPGGLTNYIVPGLASFADLRDAGQLEVRGGAFVGAGGNTFDAAGLFNLAGTSKLLLDGVTIDNGKTGAVQYGDTSSVTLQGGTLIRNCAQTSGLLRQTINSNHGSPTLVMDNATITGSPYDGVTLNVGSATPSITLRNGAVIEKSARDGIVTAGTLTLDNARVSDNGGTGVDLESGTLITSAGTVIRNNAQGINLRLASAYTLTMRNTQVINNTRGGLVVAYAEGGTFDLGTAASIGGNTFKGNGTNVTFSGGLSTADLVVNAVGNTWDATANGADSTGHFPASTTFVAPPSVSGTNVNLVQGGAAAHHVSLVAAP